MAPAAAKPPDAKTETPKAAAQLSRRQQTVKDHKDYLETRKAFIAQLLGDEGLKAEQVIGAALAYIAAVPALWPCDQESVYDAVIAAAKRNLLVGPEGYAYLVPYKERDDKGKVVRVVCQYQLGYKGALQLMRNSGAYTVIQAFVVHEKENTPQRLKVRRGTDGYFEFDPIVFGNRGPVVGVIVFAKLTTGEWDFEAMDVTEVNLIRGRSQSYGSNPEASPWHTDWERMALKTVIKRFGQRAEMSAEDRRALHDDDESDRAEKAIDVTPGRAAPGSLPSAESSAAMRTDQVMSQADRVKADLKREPAEEVVATAKREPPASEAPPHDEDGVVLDKTGKPEQAVVPPEAGAVKTEPPPAEAKKAAAKSEPPADAAPATKPPPKPGDGVKEASSIIDNAEAASTLEELEPLKAQLAGAIEGGRMGSTHVARSQKALEAAAARIEASK